MNHQELKTTKDNYTRITSDINRNLAFAGIAIIWVFVSFKDESIFIASKLLLALLFYVTTLLLDLIQYIFLSTAWVLFYRYLEKEKKDKLKFPWKYLFKYKENETKEKFKSPKSIPNTG